MFVKTSATIFGIFLVLVTWIHAEKVHVIEVDDVGNKTISGEVEISGKIYNKDELRKY